MLEFPRRSKAICLQNTYYRQILVSPETFLRWGRREDGNNIWGSLLGFSVFLGSHLIRNLTGAPFLMLFQYKYFHVQFQLEADTVDHVKIQQEYTKLALGFLNLRKAWVRAEFIQNYLRVPKAQPCHSLTECPQPQTSIFHIQPQLCTLSLSLSCLWPVDSPEQRAFEDLHIV